MRAAERAWPWRAALVALLAGALALRLWGVRHGLPYVYNTDENAHFVPTAIGLFGHDWDPGYFVNPPAYTYVLHLVLLAAYHGRAAVSDAFARNPTGVFLLARATSAALGTAAVGLLYLAGARLRDRATGLIAAAVLAAAFLPVFYGHLALNDAPTLAPVCLALAGAAGALRRGRRGDWVLAGLGVGLAAATKYTGGIVLLCVVAAAVPSRAWRGLALAGAVAVAAFLLADPYAVITPGAFWDGLRHQSSAAGDAGGKLGQAASSGIGYYLWTLTWGLGWAPALAALAGAVLLAVRDRPAFWLLVPAPVAFLLFMGLQGRFFGRWLMPVLPLACLLAALAVVALRRRALVAAGAAALVAQGLVYSVHVDRVLARPATENLARAWLVANVPAGSRIVVEPGVMPDAWATDVGHAGARWVKFSTSRARFEFDGTPIPEARRPVVNVEDYERTLQPRLVDAYARGGYCWVVSGSTQSGRAAAQPARVPGAVAYYRRLARRARVAHVVSPYRPGAGPVAFNFDASFDFYPLAYARPGPVVTIYRLTGGRCH